MPTYGYIRVSTNRQDLSVEAQREAVERAAQYHGNSLPDEIFCDPDTSGSTPFMQRESGRALIQAVRADIAAGASPTIIVTKVDRMGRDTVDVSQTVSQLNDMGARLVLLDINVDTRTPMGRAFMQIAAVFAELERARIRERIQTTLDLKRSQGLVVGTVPFGWDARDTGAVNKGGKPIRELVPNPDEQQWILHMARQRAAGMSLARIAADLNRRGVPTKRHGETLNLRAGDRGASQRKPTGKWNFGTVSKVLTNKATQALLATFPPH